MMPRFKVLHGVHSEGDKTYMPGDVVNSRSNLSRHNIPHGIQRFQLLSDTEAKADVDSSLDSSLHSLTVPALREKAEEKGIELGSVYMPKPKLIALIEEHAGGTNNGGGGTQDN